MKRFKLLAVFSLCLISLFALGVSGEATFADVNNDGEYSTDDAILALRYASNVEIPDAQQFAMADVMHDNAITTDDAIEILRVACGISVVPDHLYTEWVTTEEPTCTKSGIITCTCLICDEVFYGEIPQTDHNYSDGVCSLCGHITEKPYVAYNGSTVNFGDEPSTVINKLGNPQDILSDYNTSLSKVVIYVYCDDYANLGIFTFTDNKLTQFYTNNANNSVTHDDYVYDLDTSDVNDLYIDLTADVNIRQYVDTHATDGEYVYSYVATVGDSYTFENYSGSGANEKLIFHLTNGLRALHGKSALQYCSVAAETAYKHSSDMATRDYFDHTNPEGLSPGDRLTAEGVEWIGYGENIAAGYTDAYNIADGWYNSLGHRNNLLNSNHEYVGIGIARNPDSDYRYYGTQNFYRD